MMPTSVSPIDLMNAYERSLGVKPANQAVQPFSQVLAAAGGTGSESLDDIFVRAAQTYDVPVELLRAIAKAESGFNPNAVSPAGAQGIMQLMPGTARGLGVTDPFDPEQNIMGGAKYISQSLKNYNGDVSLALAAYNAGGGAVAKYGGIPPYKGTQNYVKKVMGYMEDQGLRAPGDIVTGATMGQNNGAPAPSALQEFDALVARWKAEMNQTMLSMLLEDPNQPGESPLNPDLSGL